MADFSGISDFVQAITGGGQAAGAQQYDIAMNRLIKQRAAQTSLDKQLEQLAREKSINQNRGQLSTLIEDPLTAAITLGGSGVGANFSGAQRGQKTAIEREALQGALNAILGSQEGGGEIPVDLVNAFTGVSAGKLQSPSNVRVNEQALADIAATAALTGQRDASAGLSRARETELLPEQVEAMKALTGQRQAAAERAERTGGSSLLTGLKAPTDEQLSLLFEEVAPATEGGFLGIGAKEAELEDLYPEFEAFRAERALMGEDMRDPGIAIQKFLAARRGATQPVAGENPPTETAAVGQVAPEDQAVLMEVAAARIAAGEDPAAINAVLRELGLPPITIQ